MTRFNLSEWAINHRALVLFLILLLGGAGLYSYRQSRPRRGPLLHHQDHGGERRLAGRDGGRDAGPGRRQDREEAPGAALSRPRRHLFPARRVLHPRDVSSTPRRRARSRTCGYQLRKKVGDIRGELPAGMIGPGVNDEYGDVYSVALHADGRRR